MIGIVKANAYRFFPVISHSNGLIEKEPWWSGRGEIPKKIMVETFSSYRVVVKQEKMAMDLLGQEVEFTLDEVGEATINILNK